MPGLEMRAVVKTLFDGTRRFRLDIPQFDLGIGNLKAIVGRTGSGKTTALDMFALASGPDTAERFTLVDRDGRRWDRIDRADDNTLARLRASNFGYVLQTNPLLPFLNLQENAALSQRITGRVDDDYLAHLLDRLLPGLPGTTRVSQMSVGQRQRLSIIRALAHRPPLILCDEPTAALDDETALTLLDLLVSLARESLAGVLVVTHDGELLRGLGFQQFAVRPGSLPDGGNLLEPVETMS